MKTNKKKLDYRVDRMAPRLAGGRGVSPAAQDAEALLKRAVFACLLWEDLFYQSGASVAQSIADLIPQVEPQACFQIAVDAREKQKLRHIPLVVAREMARHDTHKGLVGALLPLIIKRADEMAEFLSIYTDGGDRRKSKEKLSKQVKIGLAKAFGNFDAYHFAKYRGKGNAVTLRDALFLSHSKPGQGREELYRQIVDDTLPVAETWEVLLSSGADKKATWEYLIAEKKIGALAFLRNIRNMEDVGVSRQSINSGFETINPRWLLPINYVLAAKAAPKWEREIESMMLRGLNMADKLPGYTIFVVDISGSMDNAISGKGISSRLDAACAMAMIAAEQCEHVTIYATSGDDGRRIHATSQVPARHGFGLIDAITQKRRELGGGGIFTRQCLEYIKAKENETPDRIIVFSDSQDCDNPASRVPAPFGKKNYIVDVSAHNRGINYDGVWTAEISGWSEHFLTYIAALEGLSVQEVEESN